MRRQLTFALLLCGCLDAPLVAPPTETGAGLFARPQALVYAGEHLVVASTAFDGEHWGAGFLTVIDPQTGEVLNRIPTSRPNPQRMAVHAGWLYVVATGPLDLAADPPRAAGAGAIDALPIDQLATAMAPARSVDVGGPDARHGAPVDLAFVDDRALLGLAVAHGALLFDAGRHALTRGPDDPVRLGEGRLGLGSVVAWQGRFLLVDFNTDRLHVVEPDGRAWACAVEVGESPDALEGAQSLAVHRDVLYVTLTFSGVVRAVELGALREGPDCGAPPVRTAVGPLGQVPNHLAFAGGLLLVVHSGDNNVVGYDPRTGREQRRWVLPVGSNPWHVAVSPDGLQLAVTEWATDALSLFDFDARAPTMRVGAAADEGAPRPVEHDAERADTVVDAPGASGEGFGDPARAVNGVRGGGATVGGTDVYALRHADGREHLVLRWSGRRVVDRPGADLVVFENAFESGVETFVDAVVVEVSRDGARWVAFPHDYRATDERVWSGAPEAWAGFAGRTPVRLHEERNPVDPFGPAAGGDRFDLADLPGEEGAAIRAEGVVFVRLSSASTHLNPDTGAPYPAHPVSDGADIDGVYAARTAPE